MAFHGRQTITEHKQRWVASTAAEIALLPSRQAKAAYAGQHLGAQGESPLRSQSPAAEPRSVPQLLPPLTLQSSSLRLPELSRPPPVSTVVPPASQTSSGRMLLGCWFSNCLNLLNKMSELRHLVQQGQPHLVGLVETWLSPNIADGEVGIPDYNYLRCDSGADVVA